MLKSCLDFLCYTRISQRSVKSDSTQQRNHFMAGCQIANDKDCLRVTFFEVLKESSDLII